MRDTYTIRKKYDEKKYVLKYVREEKGYTIKFTIQNDEG